MIFLSKFISILRESRNDHNSRTSSTHNTNDLLEPQGLSATIQIQVDSEDKQIKQNAMQILHWYAKYSECIAKYIWAWKFLISHRQWSWNRLMALQIWLFFFSWYTGSCNLLVFFQHYSYLFALSTILSYENLNQYVIMARNYCKISGYFCQIVRSSSQGFVTTS